MGHDQGAHSRFPVLRHPERHYYLFRLHNDGSAKSEHDGIHTFHIGKNARVRYVEKHYGEGDGSGERVLNPTTEVELEEGAYCEMEMVQIKGVDSTIRETTAHLANQAVISRKVIPSVPLL